MPPPQLLEYVVYPLEGLAVPTFFVISSFLFFRKYRVAEEKLQTLWHFWKRLAILYLFWSILWSPIIYIQKDYFHPFTVWSPLMLIKDFLFGSTFDASWFLGALLVGVPLTAGLIRLLRNRFFWIVPVLAFGYICQHEVIDGSTAWDWYEKYINEGGGMWLSFPAGLIWIAIGYVFSCPNVCESYSKWKSCYVAIAAFASFTLSTLFPNISRLITVMLLFVAAYNWQLPNHTKLYKRFRIYSIHLYVIHGCFKKIPKQLWGWHNGPLLYCITIAVCLLASEFILRMRNVKGFNWLKYAY